MIRTKTLLLNDLQAYPDLAFQHPERLLNQLMVLSLLYDEILIPDDTIVFSNSLIGWLSTREGMSQWSQLLDIGSIRILLHPLKEYRRDDIDIQDEAQKWPLHARATERVRRSTHSGRPFLLTAEQKNILVLLDDGLRQKLGSQGFRSAPSATNANNNPVTRDVGAWAWCGS